MIHHATADTAEEIARLLRSRGRIVVTGPSRCGKTTELIRYAEERYHNGRFAVVSQPEQHAYIIRLHWSLYNGISFSEICAKRLLGEKLEGEDVLTPVLYDPNHLYFRHGNNSTPIFVDDWNLISEDARRIISKQQLFVGAVGTID